MVFYTAKQLAEKWHLSVQQIRKYCKDGKIKSALLYEGQWLIPEGTKPPIQEQRDNPKTPMMKKILYQLERNAHFGIYEYIQVNLAYSSSRMASNRITRNQVMEIYRTNRITPAFEPTKVDDIFEIANHFLCVRYVMENTKTPLTVDFVKHLHHLLTYGTYADKRQKLAAGALRNKPAKWGSPPEKISRELTILLQNYEKWSGDYEFSSADYEFWPVDYEASAEILIKILALHVQFERIHPFDDYNGRVGRILMLKECLRLGITPFVIDDKHRGAYHRGIASWNEDPDQLTSIVTNAQNRLLNQLDTLNLLQYHRPLTGRGAR